MICPNCQTDNPPGSKFCNECGTSLEPPVHQPQPGGIAVSPHSLPAQLPITPLQSLISPDFAAKLETARLQKTMVGERRVVTMLFCDVKGSTEAASRFDPEEWAGIINGAFERMIAPIYHYEGTVARLMGDGLLAFFGAPIAHEDDPQRAILAGLKILEGIANYNDEVFSQWGFEIDARVGINTGLVVVGAVGSDLQMEYTALGDAINLAARMEQTATPGTVQVSEDTHKLAAPLFDWEDLGEVEVKGKEQAIHTYRPLRLKEKPGRLRGLESHGISSPLVGRDSEIRQLRAAFEQLQTGIGSVVLILGEAGLGKSRLVAELRQFSITHDESLITFLEGRTLSFGQTIAYWPFQEILRNYAGIRADNEEHTAWEKLEKCLVVSFGKQTPEILPYLASLLSLHISDEYAERVKYLDAEALGRQVFFASRRFFERLAEERPLVLVFEDIHWMDNSSARLMEHLIPLVERVPLLLIGVGRPDWDTPIAEVRETARTIKRSIEIELHPLSGTDSARLVKNLFEIEALPAHVREMIIQKSDGNPFFIEEVIRTLITTGAVRRNLETGQWRATTEIAIIHIPDTIQGVIMARVDRLDEEVKRVLRTAAVIGRSFLYRVLHAVETAREELEKGLGTLQEVELIREKRRDPELEFIFKHALAQEAAYENTLLQTRRMLHFRVGTAIEVLFADRLEEFFGLLAYHYARAENWEKAQEYLFKAGDQAGRVAADAEALTHYQQAMAAYERAFGDQWDPFQRAVLERKIGEALFRRGDHDEARRYLCRALELLGVPFPTEISAVRGALVQAMLRHVGHRVFPGLFLRGRPIEDSPSLREELEIYNALIWIEVINSPERFMLASLRALAQAERANIIEWISEGFSGLQVVCAYFGFYRLGGYYGKLAHQSAQQSGEPTALALSYQIQCMHASWMGRGAEAIQAGDIGAEYHQKAGDLRGWGAAIFLAGETQVYMGDFDLVQERAAKLIQSGEDGGDPQVLGWGYSILAPVQQFSGDLPQAIYSFQKYLAIAETISDAVSMLEATTQLAHCYVMQGNLEKTLRTLARSEQIQKEHNVIGRRFLGRLHNVRAETLLLAAEKNQGDAKTEWLRKAGAVCKTARRFNLAYPPWLAWSYRLQGRYEQLCGKPDTARRWYTRSLVQAEKIGQTHEASLTRKYQP